MSIYYLFEIKSSLLEMKSNLLEMENKKREN